VLQRWQTKLFANQPGLPLLREALEASLLARQTLRAQALSSFRQSKQILVATFGEHVMGHRQPLVPPLRQFAQELDVLLEVLEDEMNQVRLFPASPYQKNALIGAKLDVATLCRDRAVGHLSSTLVDFVLQGSDRAAAFKDNAYNLLCDSARSMEKLKEELADQRLVISLAMAAASPLAPLHEGNQHMEVFYSMRFACPVLESGLAFPVYDLPPWALVQPSLPPLRWLTSCVIAPALLQPGEVCPPMRLTNGEPGH
jgi:hypothetical protein